MTYKRALEADARLAAKNALKIRAALRQTFDPKRVYEQYLLTQPNQSDSAPQNNARARAWVMLNVRVNMEALKEVMLRVWAEGYVTGEAFADEQLRIAREIKKADDTQAEIDWANWQPGDRAAALILRPPKAFQQLLASQGITFKEFSDTTVRDIGNAIGEAIELGLPAERAAKRIMTHVANPARALSIAITEQNRAISYATVNRYKEAGLEQMEWEVSSPCDKCAQNANQVVQIGQPFKSGSTQPPQHPHCRCVLLPVLPDFEEQQVPGATVITPPTTPAFPTPKQQIEEIVTALQTPKPVTDDTVEMIYRQMDMRGYEPGNWEIVPREVVREVAIQNAMRSVRNLNRAGIESFFTPNRISRADKALIEKGVIYKNGKIEVQFSSAGLKTTAAERQMVLDEVDRLQTLNPKNRAVVHIDKNSSSKYGWAYGGQSDLWVTPKVVSTPDLGAAEKGGFKMPTTEKTTQLQYTLTHEWGHLIDDIDNGAQSLQRQVAIGKIQDAYPNEFRSRYSAKNDKEFYAEMFTEYMTTNGQTPNKMVQAMAKEFGWKVPQVAVVKPVYVPAKKTPDYFTVKKAEELQDGVPWQPDGENLYLKKVLDEQGFNGKPVIVSPAEYQKAIDSGAVPLYRGVAGDTPEQVDQFVTQLLDGDTPYVGRGMFGDGTYFTDKPTTALKFAKEDRVGNPINFGKTIDAALSPQAKIIDLEDIRKEFQNTSTMTQAQKDLYYSYPQDFYEDASMWAAANGYDAIRIKNPVVNWQSQEALPDTYTIILNRTALIIKEMP